MTIDNTMLIMIVLFVIGLALLFTALLRKHAGPLKGVPPVLAAVLGVIMVIPGFYYGVLPLLPVTEPVTPPVQVIIPGAETHYATFTITMAAGGNMSGANFVPTPMTLSANKKTIVVPFSADQATGTDYCYANYSTSITGANITGDVNVSFHIQPIAWEGADSTSLCTIYYEVPNPDQTISVGTGSGPYYLYTQSADQRQIMWFDLTGGTYPAAITTTPTTYVSGSKSMLLTSTQDLSLALNVDASSLARVQNNFDTVTQPIIFSNGAGWSETFYIEWNMLFHF